jgi:hypothetical protein
MKDDDRIDTSIEGVLCALLKLFPWSESEIYQQLKHGGIRYLKGTAQVSKHHDKLCSCIGKTAVKTNLFVQQD